MLYIDSPPWKMKGVCYFYVVLVDDICTVWADIHSLILSCNNFPIVFFNTYIEV